VHVERVAAVQVLRERPDEHARIVGEPAFVGMHTQ
jgi:hypothetical protein